jgi:DNA-binding NarL/FixJ family response regulator
MAVPATLPSGANESDLTSVAVWLGNAGPREAVIGRLAADGFRLAACEDTASALLESLAESVPDAVVVVGRLDARSLESISSLATSLPDARIVVVAQRAANGDVRKALDAGVDGVLTTDQVDASLVPTLLGVLSGQVVVPQEAREHVRRPVLTTREKQILGLVVMGLSNNEIAGKLFLAESTVKSHLSSAFSKLGVSSRNEAVDLILDPMGGRGLGILTIPSERI